MGYKKTDGKTQRNHWNPKFNPRIEDFDIWENYKFIYFRNDIIENEIASVLSSVIIFMMWFFGSSLYKVILI